MGAFQGLPPMPAGSPEATPSMQGLVPQAAAPQPNVQDIARAAMNQIRQVSMNVEDLARQFPAAAQPLQVASKALQQAMVLIVSDVNRTQTSPPSPETLS